jgi:hypothetical protein
LFCKRGFDDTSMRDIAVEAGLVTGAAYSLFPVEAPLVLAYYQCEVQRAYEAEPAFDATASLEGSGCARSWNRRLDPLRRDRPFLGALVRDVGSPTTWSW